MSTMANATEILISASGTVNRWTEVVAAKVNRNADDVALSDLIDLHLYLKDVTDVLEGGDVELASRALDVMRTRLRAIDYFAY
jgi:hypothetical protein